MPGERRSGGESNAYRSMIIARMVSSSAGNWTVRGTTFLVWALAAASAAYWGLKLSASSSVLPPVAGAARQAAPADPMAVARLMGYAPNSQQPAVAAAAPLSSRFSLVGVVADRAQQGAALISVEGRPARTYRV